MNAVKPSRGLTQTFLQLATGNLIFTLVNLGRDIAVARSLGVTASADIFFLAISIPIFLVSIGALALRSVAVPALERAAQVSPANVEALSQRLGYLVVATILTLLIALEVGVSIGFLLSIGGFFSDAIRVFCIASAVILPSYALMGFIECSQGALQVKGVVFLPGILRAGLPLGLAVGAVLFESKWSLAGIGMSSAICAGAAAGAMWYLLMQQRMTPSRQAPRLPPDTGHAVWKNYRALVVAMSITMTNPLVDQWMAGMLGEGAVSALGFANRLAVGLVALVTVALSPVLLSHFGRLVASGDVATASRSFGMFTRAGMWMGSAATLLVWWFGEWLIVFLYGHGRFTQADSVLVTKLLYCYAAQTPLLFALAAPNALIAVLSRNSAFVRQGVLLLVANITGNLVFMSVFGVMGIAISTVMVYALSWLGLNWFLRRDGEIHLNRTDLVRCLLPLGLLAVVGYGAIVLPADIPQESSAIQVAIWMATPVCFGYLGFVTNRDIVQALRMSLRRRR